MLEDEPGIRAVMADRSIIHVELDHHLAADSAYIGDLGYRLVTDASSTAELIGLLALKMQADRALLQREQLVDLLSRNFVLAVLTGIIGDSKMGKYLKTRRERWFYSMFSAIFERLLAQKTEKDSGNFASMQQVFAAIQALSNSEEKCYQYLMSRKQLTGAIGRITLDQSASKELFWRFAAETVVAVAKAAADNLAEESGRLGLIGYYDDPLLSDLVQFRLRRSKNFTSLDLRTILEKFGIADGGGHPGAIGFRFPKNEIDDIEKYAVQLTADLSGLMISDG
jgi:nanoRNase/pAp phosphatase (c-di-AMP/oligoRNAs hydrolase)